MIKGEKRIQLAMRLIALGADFPEVADELDKFIESLYQKETKLTIDCGVLHNEFHLAKTDKIGAIKAYRQRIGVENISLMEAKAVIEESLSRHYCLTHGDVIKMLDSMK